MAKSWLWALKEYKPVESKLNILSNTSLDGKSNITKSSSSEQIARARKSAHRFKRSLPNSHYKKVIIKKDKTSVQWIFHTVRFGHVSTSNITKSSSSEQIARARKSAHRFKRSLPNSHYKKGQDFCPVNFFTGHGQIWTRVRDSMCPVDSLL